MKSKDQTFCVHVVAIIRDKDRGAERLHAFFKPEMLAGTASRIWGAMGRHKITLEYRPWLEAETESCGPSKLIPFGLKFIDNALCCKSILKGDFFSGTYCGILKEET